MTEEKNTSRLVHLKEFIGTIGIIAAFVVSIISIMQSDRALKLSQAALDIDINVSGTPIDNSVVDFNVPNYCTRIYFLGALSFDFKIQLDNLSARKVSIREIRGTSILDGEDFFFFTGYEEIDTDNLFGPLFRDTEEGLVSVRLPLTLDEGDSIDLTTKLTWPLDETSCQIIRTHLDSNELELTLSNVRQILAMKGTSLSQAAVKYNEWAGKGGSGWAMDYLEPQKLQLKLEVNTSFNTYHAARIDI